MDAGEGAVKHWVGQRVSLKTHAPREGEIVELVAKVHWKGAGARSQDFLINKISPSPLVPYKDPKAKPPLEIVVRVVVDTKDNE